MIIISVGCYNPIYGSQVNKAQNKCNDYASWLFKSEC